MFDTQTKRDFTFNIPTGLFYHCFKTEASNLANSHGLYSTMNSTCVEPMINDKKYTCY